MSVIRAMCKRFAGTDGVIYDGENHGELPAGARLNGSISWYSLGVYHCGLSAGLVASEVAYMLIALEMGRSSIEGGEV